MSEVHKTVDLPFRKIARIFALLSFPIIAFAAGAMLLLSRADQGNYIFVLPLLAVAVICVGIPLAIVSAVTITWFMLWVAHDDVYG